MEQGGHVFYSVWLRVKRGRGEHRSDFWGRRDPKKLRGRPTYPTRASTTKASPCLRPRHRASPRSRQSRKRRCRPHRPRSRCPTPMRPRPGSRPRPRHLLPRLPEIRIPAAAMDASFSTLSYSHHCPNFLSALDLPSGEGSAL
jgi:hypothetical protein